VAAGLRDAPRRGRAPHGRACRLHLYMEAKYMEAKL
jgi:hypothetical protein